MQNATSIDINHPSDNVGTNVACMTDERGNKMEFESLKELCEATP